MRSEIRERVCALLTEALDLLDGEGAAIAGIQVAQAIETLRCGVSDPQDRSDSAVAPRSPSTTRAPFRAPGGSGPASSPADR